MKVRLNLTIEEDVLNKVKAYAGHKQSSVSRLAEEYFLNIAKDSKKEFIIDLIESLPKPKIDLKADLKKFIMKKTGKKMAFKVI